MFVSCCQQRGWMYWAEGQAPPAPILLLIPCRISSQQRHQRETVEFQSAPRQTQAATEQLSKKPRGIKVNPQPQLCTKVQEVLPHKQYFSM